MRFQRKKNPNAVVVLKDLSHLMALKISPKSFQKIVEHQEFPSMISLIDTMSEWNVASIGVRLEIDQLKDIPYPAIAHLHKNNGHFVILKKMEHEYIHYIDPEIGSIKDTLDNFNRKWTGAVLLVEKNKKSGEDG